MKRGYVYDKDLESTNEDIELNISIFREKEDEFRPILTATSSNYEQGFSKRRSFKSQEAAMEFYQDNQDLMIEEAIGSLS